MVIHYFKKRPAAVLAGYCGVSFIALLALQVIYDLEPCPLCILQRIALLLTAAFAMLSIFLRAKLAPSLLAFGFSVAGLGVAAWHWYLQAHPFAFSTCTPGFSFMLESLSLAKILPLVFHGSGSCMLDTWRLFGVTLPQLSAAFFASTTALATMMAISALKSHRNRRLSQDS